MKRKGPPRAHGDSVRSGRPPNGLPATPLDDGRDALDGGEAPHGTSGAGFHALEAGGAERTRLFGYHRVHHGGEAAVVESQERLAHDLLARAVAQSAQHTLVGVVHDDLVGNWRDGPVVHLA